MKTFTKIFIVLFVATILVWRLASVEDIQPENVLYQSASTGVVEKIEDITASNPQSPIASEEKTIYQERTTFKIGDKNLELYFNPGETLESAMNRMRLEGTIHFTGKEFPVLGFFVTEIENIKEGNGKFLFFYINGAESNVGISNYKLKAGDHIEWKLKD